MLIPSPAVALLLAFAVVAMAAPPATPGSGTTPPAGGKSATGTKRGTAKSIYAPIPKDDRKALEDGREYRIPKPTDDLVWIGTEPMTQSSFEGKVTVIQSLGGKQSLRTTLERTKRALPEGVVLLGLHTPEEIKDAPKPGNSTLPCPMAVDPSGKWCDALGVWTTPVNIVVNKAGAVAYVALTDDGLREVLPQLLAEDLSDVLDVPERPAPDAQPADGTPAADKPAAPVDVQWPSPEAGADGALIGSKMPEFQVEKWLSPAPDRGNRLVAMDFWATWCPPCRASIPHLNELQEKYAKDILVVGISDEPEQKFNEGLKRYKLSPSGFKYSVALDTKETLKSFFKITGIPHLAIASADGIVRWRGHPMSLKPDMLDKLVAANRTAFPQETKAAAGAKKPRGWSNQASAQKSR